MWKSIADLSGLKLTLWALRAQPNSSQDEGKLTPTQKFFYCWARYWRQNINKEHALQLLTLDLHGPNNMQCNEPVSNILDFIHAFNFQEDNQCIRNPVIGSISDKIVTFIHN